MSRNIEIGLFIVRLVLGLSFFVHGLDKFQGGISNTAAWFGNIGLPTFLAYVVAVIELVGGISMILGLGTRIVSIMFALIMVGAMFKVKLAGGFLNGYELDLAFLSMSLLLALSGNRFVSIDLLFSIKNNSGTKTVG